MLVSLYTVRVVLNVLGAEDYGIYNVVAGVVTMFSFLSGAMASASQRYFSFDLGKGDTEHLKITFSVTLSIYLLLILVVVILAETVGLWFVNNKLVIPQERMNAAKWIYQFAVLNFVVTMITTPYMASIIAHENMDIYAYVSIVEAALKLAVVFVLKILPYDKLIVYGILLFAVGFINTAIYRSYCKKHYEECRFRPVWDGKMFKEITGYVGWNMFGSAVGVVSNQGVNIVLNQFAGAVVNATRSIALQINSAVTSFASNFNNATRPQIIKSYAANKKQEMLSLMNRSSKMCFFLMFVFALPLCLEMPFILKLWLKNPPEQTTIFAVLALLDAVIASVSYPIIVAVQATGKIRLYQGVVGGIMLLNLPSSYVVLRLGFPPYSVMLVILFNCILASIVRFFIARKVVVFSLRKFFINVILPLFLVVLISFPVPFLIVRKMESGILRFLLTVFFSVIISSISMSFIALNKNERSFLMNIIKSKLGRKNGK